MAERASVQSPSDFTVVVASHRTPHDGSVASGPQDNGRGLSRQRRAGVPDWIDVYPEVS